MNFLSFLRLAPPQLGTQSDIFMYKLSPGICIPPRARPNLVEETEDLAGNVLPAGLLVVHDTSGGGEDDEAELTRGQELDDPLLHVAELDVVAGGDDTGLVDAAVELDDDLAVAVVVDLLELANVACRKNRISEMLQTNKHRTS
jgi:hypothetical protein